MNPQKTAPEQRMVSVALLTVSDRAAAGEYEDLSGQLMAQIITSRTSWQIVHRDLAPDHIPSITAHLMRWCAEDIHLILTSGGTGFSPRDVTPEATRLVLEREAPGIAEALRLESLKITRHAMLSRAVAGIRGRTLIVNLPGSPKAVKEGFDVLLPVLPHALELLREDPTAAAGHREV